MKGALVGALLMAAAPVTAQVADNAEIAARLDAMGSELTREMVGGVGAIYAPLYGQMPSDGVEKLADLPYGPHARNMLDVWRPKGADGSQPILIFAHGGGFVRGDKGDVANIGNWFARHDVVMVALNYRYAPEATWPSGGQDMAGVMAWLRENADIHGGNPGKIFVAGNSAGAVHAATYMAFEELQAPDDGMIGAILISIPSANVADHPLDPQRDLAYFGADPATYAARSVINALDGRKVPVMLVLGEADIPLAEDQTAQMIDALRARDGKLPVISVAPGHNHISVVNHIGSGDETLAPDMLEFIRLTALRAGG